MNRIFGGKGAKAPPPPTLQEATEKVSLMFTMIEIFNVLIAIQGRAQDRNFG